MACLRISYKIVGIGVITFFVYNKNDYLYKKKCIIPNNGLEQSWNTAKMNENSKSKMC